MAWGMVGKTNWGKNPKAKPRPGEITHGFIRDLDPGVEYKSLADCQVSMPVWQPLRDDDDGGYAAPRRWIMSIGQNEAPVQVITLGQLAEKIRELDRKNHPDLRQYLSVLDDAIDQLLTIAEQLHIQHRCVGLLHPHNVMLYLPVADGAWKVVLPDAGFAWRWQGAGNVPDWLKPTHADVRQFADLWDAAPEEWNKRICKHQWADAPPPLEGWNATQDVRCLSRLLYWVLTGDVVKVIPPPSDHNPRSKLLPLVPLADALNGTNKVTVTKQLRTTFRSSGRRMSDYFSNVEKNGTGGGTESSGGRIWPWVGGAVALLALVASVTFLVFNGYIQIGGGGTGDDNVVARDGPKKDKEAVKNPEPNTNPPPSMLNDAFAAIKEQWKAVENDRAGAWKLLAEAAKLEFSDDEELRQKQRTFVGDMQRRYSELWVADVTGLREGYMPISSKAMGERYLANIKTYSEESEQFSGLKNLEDAKCAEELRRWSKVLAADKKDFDRDVKRFR